MFARAVFSLLLVLAIPGPRLVADVLYATDFSDFEPGALAGQNGWVLANEQPGSFEVAGKTLILSGQGGRVKAPPFGQQKTAYYGFDLVLQGGDSRAGTVAVFLIGDYLRAGLAVASKAKGSGEYGLSVRSTGGGGKPKIFNLQAGTKYRVVVGGDSTGDLRLWVGEDVSEDAPYMVVEGGLSGTVEAFCFEASTHQATISNLVIATTLSEAADPTLAQVH